MDQQSYLNYGYQPIYAQLQPNQHSPDQPQQFPMHESEMRHSPSQTVPNYTMPSETMPSMTEQQAQYQNDQFSYQQSLNYLPSLFNPRHHQFQSGLQSNMWHGNEQNYGFSQVVPQYYHDPRYVIRPTPITHRFPSDEQHQQNFQQFTCTDCNKNFMSATNLKRHMTTKVHYNKLSINKQAHPECPSSSRSITDLSEAEVVFIDKIDEELAATWNGQSSVPSPLSTVSSPIPSVSSSLPSASSPIPLDPDSEFRCNKCNKTFSKRCYFTQHNKIAHLGNKPFKCTKCGKKFATHVLLDDHLTKHDGEKPFKCEMCTKSFNHKTDLKRHMILHTTEKPHVCQQCGKGFVRKDHLQKHLASHARKMEKLKKAFTSS